MEEQEKRIRLENQRIQEEKQKEIDNRQMFESLIKDFLKHGSGIIKFPYDEDIEKIFINERPDISLELDGNVCTLYHNLGMCY